MREAFALIAQIASHIFFNKKNIGVFEILKLEILTIR